MKTSPLKVGDIVTMNVTVEDTFLRKNWRRLMRVTDVRSAVSQSGYVVDVKVNDNPIYDIDGVPTFELLGWDCGWFTKYEE